jgi:hypothetical protein
MGIDPVNSTHPDGGEWLASAFISVNLFNYNHDKFLTRFQNNVPLTQEGDSR